jgi:hypothetical protein
MIYHSSGGGAFLLAEATTFGGAILSVAWDGAKFIAGEQTGQLGYSADYGATWQAVWDSSFPSGGANSITRLFYGGSVGSEIYLAGGTDGRIAWSSTGM